MENITDLIKLLSHIKDKEISPIVSSIILCFFLIRIFLKRIERFECKWFKIIFLRRRNGVKRARAIFAPCTTGTGRHLEPQPTGKFKCLEPRDVQKHHANCQELRNDDVV
jgi:hypothetical protein